MRNQARSPRGIAFPHRRWWQKQTAPQPAPRRTRRAVSLDFKSCQGKFSVVCSFPSKSAGEMGTTAVPPTHRRGARGEGTCSPLSRGVLTRDSAGATFGYDPEGGRQGAPSANGGERPAAFSALSRSSKILRGRFPSFLPGDCRPIVYVNNQRTGEPRVAVSPYAVESLRSGGVQDGYRQFEKGRDFSAVVAPIERPPTCSRSPRQPQQRNQCQD